jgi:hypothetical protein
MDDMDLAPRASPTKGPFSNISPLGEQRPFERTCLRLRVLTNQKSRYLRMTGVPEQAIDSIDGSTKVGYLQNVQTMMRMDLDLGGPMRCDSRFANSWLPACIVLETHITTASNYDWEDHCHGRVTLCHVRVFGSDENGTVCSETSIVSTTG